MISGSLPETSRYCEYSAHFGMGVVEWCVIRMRTLQITKLQTFTLSGIIGTHAGCLAGYMEEIIVDNY